MLDEFPEGSLPGQDPRERYDYDDSDIATFEDLWLSAVLIEICCLTDWLYGWSIAGRCSSPPAFKTVVLLMPGADLP